MGAHLLVFSVCAATAYFATPLAGGIARRAGAIAVPNDRTVHTDPTPSLGGLAIWAAAVAGVLLAWRLEAFDELFRTSTEPWGVLLAATAISVVGAVDDTRRLGPWSKIAGQVMAGAVLVLLGVQIFYFWLPGVGLVSLSSDLSAVLTILWIIALMNSMNLIDGLDGLAAGVSSIAALGFFAYAYVSADGSPTTATLVSAIVAGSCLGFLPHNFNPARIFMGDTGSLLLGLLLAAATVSGVGRTTEPQFADVAGLVVPVLLPLFVLAIPLADAGLAIMRRVRGRRPVFHADKEHIHHWLFDMASSHRKAVLVMYLWSAMIVGSALALAVGRGIVGRAIASGLFAGVVVSILVVPRVLRRGGPAAAAGPPSSSPMDVGVPPTV